MVEGAETLNICIKKTCYEYELDGGFNHKYLQWPTSYTNYIHSQVPEGIHEGVVALWPLEIVAGAETLYICMKKTCYEYEGNGGSQS